MKTVRIAMAGILLGLGIVLLNSCAPTPLVTIEWEEDGGMPPFIQFQTNDPANASQTFLKLYPSTDHGSMGMSYPLEVIAKKVLGSIGASYGIVFCATSDQNYFKIVIRTTAEYSISQVVPGGESFLRDWRYSNYLNAGWNRQNRIKVEWIDGATDHFTVAFNGVTEYVSPDYIFPGGQSGFFASVSDALTEYFPTSTVDVRFRMLTPDTIPP